jgi:hypothetical protein
MNDREPRRLLEDPASSARLREDLQAAKDQTVVAYDVAAGLGVLRATLDAGVVSGAAGSAGGASGASGAVGASGATGAGAAGGLASGVLGVGLKWMAAAVCTAGTVGGTWLALHDEPRPTTAVERPAATRSEVRTGSSTVREPSPEPSRLAQTPVAMGPAASPNLDGAAPSAPHGGNELPQPTVAVGAVEPAPLGRAPTQRGQGKASARPSTVAQAPDAPTPSNVAGSDHAAPTGDQNDEVKHLAEVRRALQSSPSLALQLARRGQQDYPHGTFGEEREAIVVFALQALGRADEARSEGRAFLRAHPQSPFAARIRDIVTDGATQAAP